MNKLLIACIVTFLGDASAASFDCEKAKTKAEILICGTPILSKADEDLYFIFEKAKGKNNNSQEFREGTRLLWNEREKCSDINCVASWYVKAQGHYNAIIREPLNISEKDNQIYGAYKCDFAGFSPVDNNGNVVLERITRHQFAKDDKEDVAFTTDTITVFDGVTGSVIITSNSIVDDGLMLKSIKKDGNNFIGKIRRGNHWIIAGFINNDTFYIGNATIGARVSNNCVKF